MPSFTDGCEPFNQPGAWVPQRFSGTQDVGILSPAAPVKRYQAGKDSGASCHIASSFDPYLQHYG